MDKKISQLNIRPLLADTDVFPVVASGSTETNKATLLNLRNNYLFPVISGNAGRFLTTDGTSIFWDFPPVPTLDQVLTAGNVSDNEIILNGGINGDLLLDGNDTFVGGVPTLLIRNLTTNQNHRLLIDRSIFNNNGFQLDLLSPTLTGTRVLTYPNASGTFAISVNGFTANSSGEITLPGIGAFGLNDLTDVTIASPADGQVLTFDSVSGQWQNEAIPTAPIPNLQEVTDEGFQTTNEIRVQDNTIAPQQELILNNLFVAISDSVSGKDASLEVDKLIFFKNNQSLSTTLTPTPGATSVNTLQLPDGSGTLVASVNGVIADNFGNVLLPIGATNLDELNDVTIASPSNGDVLTFDSVSGEWQNQPNPGATTPTLQQVTTAGNTTNQSIQIFKPSGLPFEGLRIMNGSQFAVELTDVSTTPGIPSGQVTIRSPFDYLQFESNVFRWISFSGQTNVGYNSGAGINNINFPNGSGTLLLSVNGQGAGLSGTASIGLDSVLTQNPISDNSFSILDDLSATTRAIEFDAPGSIIRSIDTITGEKIEVVPNNISFFNGISGVQTLSKNPNLTSTQTDLFLPIIDNKTLVASVNGIFANDQGDISVPTGATTLDGLTDVTITTPSNGQGLIFDSISGQWQNQTIPSGSTGTLQQVTDNGNTTTNDIVLQDAAITGIDFLDFDLTPSTATNQEGRVQWNDDLKTIQIDTENAGVQINVGHETIQRVRNVTGATITKGKICYINGASGNRPTITLSDNSSDSTSAQTIGFAAADIPNNSNGYLITNGILENISTIGFATGTQLFLSSNGNFQSTFPTQPLHNVRVGIVIDGNSPTGSIFVNILNGFELEELHDCLITSPANNQVLTYETASGLWKNKAIPAATIPDLQQVATAGAETTLTLRVSNTISGTTHQSTISPFVIAQRNISTGAETQIAGNDIRFIRGGFQTNLKANDSVPAVGTLTLPNGSGTLVKSVNGVSPDINGDVVVSGGGGATDLNGLSDVTIATPTAGQSLVFNSVSSQWENVKVGSPWTIDFGFTAFNLQASETYVTGLYYGAQPSTLINNRPSRKAIIQKSGFLKNVQVLSAMSAAAGSGNMILTFINETQGTSQIISSTYGISSISLSSLSRLDLFSGFNFAVNVGDVVQMRIQTPAWSTLPTGVSMQFVTLFES